MFTNLQHNATLKNIITFLNICFNNASKMYVATDGFNGFYANDRNNLKKYAI